LVLEAKVPCHVHVHVLLTIPHAWHFTPYAPHFINRP